MSRTESPCQKCGVSNWYIRPNGHTSCRECRRRANGWNPTKSIDLDLFVSKIRVTDGCWQWIGGLTVGGYGRHGDLLAHRLAYELWVGPIPDGLTIDHLCRVTSCVNPTHMEPVTSDENVRRGAEARRRERANGIDECVNGHLWTPENTYMTKQGRRCRACTNAGARRRYYERKATA